MLALVMSAQAEDGQRRLCRDTCARGDFEYGLTGPQLGCFHQRRKSRDLSEELVVAKWFRCCSWVRSSAIFGNCATIAPAPRSIP
jgi:hypothetical protein